MALARPFLLSLFAGALIVQAALLPLFALFAVLSSSDSVVIYNGVEAAMGEVRWKILGMLVVWFALAACFGLGLWRGSAMARRAFLATCFLLAVAGLVATFLQYKGTSDIGVALAYVGLADIIGCALFWWYLYMKPNVREFFEHRTTRIASAA